MRTEMGSYRKVPRYQGLCSGPECVLGQVEHSLQWHVQWRVGFTGALLAEEDESDPRTESNPSQSHGPWSVPLTISPYLLFPLLFLKETVSSFVASACGTRAQSVGADTMPASKMGAVPIRGSLLGAFPCRNK